MAEKISLDDSSYEAVYEKAVKKMEKQAPWWTHREISDPGITFTEMWALLIDMQSYYMDQVQESHYRKYLKLLGIALDEGECASAWIFFDDIEQECAVPEGTKLLAEKMVFETEKEIKLTTNCLTGFYSDSLTDRVTIMRRYRKNKFFLTDKERLFVFILKEPIGKGEEFEFFVLLDETKKRNPVKNEFNMVLLAWEYETESGWREAEVVSDETKGLLYSGSICIRIDSDMKKGEDGYKVKCRIKKGSYDVIPVLYKICLNTVRARQRNTLCKEEHLRLIRRREYCEAFLKSYLAKTGEIKVFLSKGNGFWEDITGVCEIDPPVTEERMERKIRFYNASDLNFLRLKENEIKVICSVPKIKSECETCDITGVSTQNIALRLKNLMRSRVEIMLRQGTGSAVYREYRREEPEEDRYENAWHWHETDNTIILGDGRHGDIPKAAEDGLFFTSMVLYEGEKGNVAIDKIRNWEKPELFNGITFQNMICGSGGRDRKSPSEQFEEIGELLLRENRLVTEDDICSLAKETPGLMIERAEAEWADGTLIISIFPKCPLMNNDIIKFYENAVENHLEQYRLAGSRIKAEVNA